MTELARRSPTKGRVGHMTMTSAAVSPAEDVVPSDPPSGVERGFTTLATRAVHTEGSVYSCPACQAPKDSQA